MKMKPMTVILVGAVVAVLGGLITAIGTYLHNKKSSERNDRMESGINKGVTIGESTKSEVSSIKEQNDQLKGQSVTLLDKIDSQQLLIDKLRVENSSLYEKLAQVSGDIYKQVIGGQASPYFEIRTIGPNEYIPFLINDNDLPVYEIFIEITDYTLASACKKRQHQEHLIFDNDCFRRCSKDFKIAELGVGNFELEKLTLMESGKLQILFKTRSKTFYQLFLYKNIKGIIESQSLIFELKGNQFVKVRNLNPRKSDWVVDWDKEFGFGLIRLLQKL